MQKGLPELPSNKTALGRALVSRVDLTSARPFCLVPSACSSNKRTTVVALIVRSDVSNLPHDADGKCHVDPSKSSPFPRRWIVVSISYHVHPIRLLGSQIG